MGRMVGDTAAEMECPSCGAPVTLAQFPTRAETEEAAAAGHEAAQSELAFLRARDAARPDPAGP